MDARISDYDVFPSVVKRGVKTAITIIPKGDHAKFNDSLEYQIKFVPLECCNVSYRLDRFEGDFQTQVVRPENGCISFTYCFEEEQEWSIVVQYKDEDPKVFHVFSVLPDLYSKRPYKGDFHVHSNRSDGREEPAIVVANYRKAGFDFMAITDHHRWRPSKEAIEKYKDVDMDLKLFLGEEVHVPGDYIHAINFGGNFSVNELYHEHQEQIDNEMSERAKKLSVPKGVNALEYSYRQWISEQIHKGGGLSILVHPYWIWCDEYNMQTKMTDYLFETNCFDAFELLGGQITKENLMQIALYNDQIAKGRKIPIVGSSDSHGTEPPIWFDVVKTILFSEDLELNSIIKNVKDFYSVAVETAQGDCYRVDGSFRMVKYALFLLDNYFPKHDEICREEGVLMKEYVCGNEKAKAELARHKGNAKAFEKKFFGC